MFYTRMGYDQDMFAILMSNKSDSRRSILLNSFSFRALNSEGLAQPLVISKTYAIAIATSCGVLLMGKIHLKLRSSDR